MVELLGMSASRSEALSAYYSGGGELEWWTEEKGGRRRSDCDFIDQARCGRWKGSGRSVISVLAMWARWLAIGAAPSAGRRKERAGERKGRGRRQCWRIGPAAQWGWGTVRAGGHWRPSEPGRQLGCTVSRRGYGPLHGRGKKGEA